MTLESIGNAKPYRESYRDAVRWSAALSRLVASALVVEPVNVSEDMLAFLPVQVLGLEEIEL